MLTHTELDECIERAVITATQIISVEEMKKSLDILGENESLSKLVHAIALEVAMAGTLRGMELHEKEQSLLVMKDGFPVLIHDKAKKILAVAIPDKGKYYLAGTDIVMDIKPDCWYDIEIFKREDADGDNTNTTTDRSAVQGHDGRNVHAQNDDVDSDTETN